MILKPAYLETLAAGEHTLTFVYENGQTTAKFTVEAATQPVTGVTGSNEAVVSNVPQTGDDSNLVLWIAVVVLCIGALVALQAYRRKRLQ